MSADQTPAATPAMPKTRAQVARVDPQPRPMHGWLGEIRLVNPRPDRRYCLVDNGAGQGRELINPFVMRARGWDFERWDSVEDGKGYGGYDVLYKPRPGALGFEGGVLVGPPGSVIEHAGASLMSIDAEVWKAQKAEGQRYADPRERAIRTNEMQAAEARSQLRRAGVRSEYAYASPMGDDDASKASPEHVVVSKPG